MKILLLADIHGNLPALQAVLDTPAAAACAEAWCLGDIVGYGPFPNECAELVARKMSRVILGNHDVKVLSAKKASRHKEAYKTFVFAWTRRVLSPATVKYLASLPGESRLKLAGHRVVLLHGSPVGMDDGLSIHTPDERLAARAVEAADEAHRRVTEARRRARDAQGALQKARRAVACLTPARRDRG